MAEKIFLYVAEVENDNIGNRRLLVFFAHGAVQADEMAKKRLGLSGVNDIKIAMINTPKSPLFVVDEIIELNS